MSDVLVTGATGYVGGRLVSRLLAAGHRVRCLVRDTARLRGRPWATEVEIVEGDVLEPETLAPALAGIDAAYYLIHSLGAGEDFAERDRRAASNFGQAAREAGVARILYLGGLKPSTDDVSSHLASRLETGDVLRESGVPVTEFRAAQIIGSGSLSFELIRYLTERVPIMVCPTWVTTRTQPIAIRDVIAYLTEALERPESTGRTFDIGSPDVLTYEEMFMLYAKVRGLNRVVVKVPVLTPSLSSRWIGFVTPLPTHIGRLLVDGLNNEVICQNTDALDVFDVAPISVEEAIERALTRFRQRDVQTAWHGAFSSNNEAEVNELTETEGMILERRQILSDASPASAFKVIKRIGGENGWLYANFLWKIRGALDALVGGVGLRRGRRNPDELYVGEALDFWRVEAVEQDRLLRLRAEMKVPGRAWLQFDVEPWDSGGSRVTQTAFFEPRGLFGLVYWYALYPLHRILFKGMLRELVRRAKVFDDAQPAAEQGTALPMA